MSACPYSYKYNEHVLDVDRLEEQGVQGHLWQCIPRIQAIVLLHYVAMAANELPWQLVSYHFRAPTALLLGNFKYFT